VVVPSYQFQTEQMHQLHINQSFESKYQRSTIQQGHFLTDLQGYKQSFQRLAIADTEKEMVDSEIYSFSQM
jgi:hypothetical protein